jgi:nucleotide-binding universal stress UspA family protein
MKENIVVIVTYKDHKVAYSLKNQLYSEGIESFLSHVESDIDENNGKGEGIRIKVKENDVEEAVKLLVQLGTDFEKNEEKQVVHYRRILVPVDFSENSVKACLFAIGIAEKMKAEIKLLHVFKDPLEEPKGIKRSGTFEKYYRDELRIVKEECKKDMIKFIETIKRGTEHEKYSQANIHFSLIAGRLSSQIPAICDSFKPDVLVMGSGSSAISSKYESQQAAIKVIENVNLPILVVPEEFDYKGVDNIPVLYVTDFLDSDHTSFRTLLSLLAPFNVKYYCIHVENKDEEVLKEQKMEELKNLTEKEYSAYDVDWLLIKNRDVINGIQAFVEQNDIKLVSFTAPKRSMIYRLLNPNNLKRMMKQIKIPMFIFRS